MERRYLPSFEPGRVRGVTVMGYRSGCYSRACVRSLLVSWRTHTHTMEGWIWQGRRYKERPGLDAGVCVRGGVLASRTPRGGRQVLLYLLPSVSQPMARVSTPSRRAALRLSPRMASPVHLGSGSQSAGEKGGAERLQSPARTPRRLRRLSPSAVAPPSLLLLSMPVGWRRHLSADPLPRMRGQ